MAIFLEKTFRLIAMLEISLSFCDCSSPACKLQDQTQLPGVERGWGGGGGVAFIVRNRINILFCQCNCNDGVGDKRITD